jgi:hypothetical protein
VNQLGFVSSYSPIYPDGEGGLVARPIYYGMLAFAHASNGKMLGLNYDPGSINLKAYAVLNHANRILVTLINKDLSTGADVRVELPGRILAAIASRLNAPSITSKEAVKFAETTVNAEGQWQPGPRNQIQPDTNGFMCRRSVPRSSKSRPVRTIAKSDVRMPERSVRPSTR